MSMQLDLFGNHVDTQAKDPVWILKSRPAPDPNSPIIVCYGGGTNSTAMLIAMVLKEIKPDLILFADTGAELPETYQWVNTFSDWLFSRRIPWD
jgi:3'-phosphoadenosine 5'-phosphosulfate sulfotransferase (PAPS reductase)/FAD synthetase